MCNGKSIMFVIAIQGIANEMPTNSRLTYIYNHITSKTLITDQIYK